jgi:hypothetical protein
MCTVKCPSVAEDFVCKKLILMPSTGTSNLHFASTSVNICKGVDDVCKFRSINICDCEIALINVLEKKDLRFIVVIKNIGKVR